MENRLHKIACRIQKEGSVRARDLAEEFGVSMETIRKELARLETERVVRREYGHAYVADDMEKRLDLRPRLEAKEAIGREIAKRLEDFHTVLLDCSSTVHKAAAPLNRMSSRDIFTNSLVLAERLDAQRHCVFVLPGRKRSKNESLIGPWTEELYREDPCGCLCAWLFGCPACAGTNVPLLHRNFDEEENDGSG